MATNTKPGGGGGLASTGGVGTTDVNLLEIGGNAVAPVGVNGMLAVGGDVPDGSAESASYPVKMGAVAIQVPTLVDDGDMAKLTTDLERHLRTRDRVYDSLTDSNKVAVQNTIASDRDNAAQLLADATDTAAATVYYPSSAGIEVGNRDFLSIIMTIDDVTSVGFEVSNDGSTWQDGTGSVVDIETGVSGNVPTDFTAAAGVPATFGVDWEKCGFRYFRLAVLFPNGTNDIEATLYARAN